MPAPRLVLTGDLVASSALSPDRLSMALDALSEAAALLEYWYDAPLHFTRHRGDGWQVCLPVDLSALRAALTFRAALRQVDKTLQTRIAIAEGSVDIPPSGDLNAASGTAFTLSGQTLDAMEKHVTIADARDGALAATAELAHHISDDWTPAQARAVLPMLAPERPTQDEVASALSITRQAVRQALLAAGFPSLSAALHHLEAA